MAEDLSNDLRATIEAAASGGGWDSDDAPATTDTQTEGRARDEGGRFAPKPEGEQAAAPPVEDDYEDGIGFERDAWGRLPQDLRPQVKTLAQQRREAEAKAKGYEPIDAALAPVRDAWTMAYGSPDKALQQLIAIERVARENPAEFLRQFAQQRGLNPATIFGQGQQAAQPQQQDPAEFVNRLVEQALEQRTVSESIQAFQTDATLEFRDDPAVRQAMAGLLQSGVAKDLKDAYEQATYAVPAIRAKRTAADTAQRAQQDSARSAQAAAERQSAAVSTVGGPGTARAPAGDAASDNSTRALASRAWDAASGRV